LNVIIIELPVNNNTGDFFMENIVITGARSGIAHHVIEKLRTKNYHIYAAVHTEKELEQMQKKYQEDLHITCLKVDITNKEDWKQLENIDIDVYFANAAIGMGGSIVNMDINKVRENYEVNIFANLELLQYILNKMKIRGNGKVLMMASLAGIIPVPFLGSYCSTKAALIKWMECLQLELKEASIPIQLALIEPGLFRTGFNQVMLENKYPEVESDEYFERIIEWLRLQDKFILVNEKKDIDLIASKIEKAIESKKMKFIYRTPCSQVVLAKIYQLLFQ